MAGLKQKGDFAELAVAKHLLSLGHRIAFPYGEDCDFDLILIRAGTGALERVQVKHTVSDGHVISVRCCSHSLTNGRVRVTKLYTRELIEWMAVYDAATGRCFYVPADELGDGRRTVSLRYDSPLVGWRRNMRRVEDYELPESA